MIFNRKYTFVAVDLGATKTIFYTTNYGILFNQDTSIAYDINSNKVLAIGNKSSWYQSSKNVKIINPLEKSNNIDYKALQDYLNNIFNLLKNYEWWKNVVLILSVPLNITILERNMLTKSLLKHKIKHLLIEDEIKMAALGCGVNDTPYMPKLILNIGGYTSTIAVIADEKILVSDFINIGSNNINHQLFTHLEQKQEIILEKSIIEKIKIDLGNLIDEENETRIKITGKDIKSHIKKSIMISTKQIHKFCFNTFEEIIAFVISILNKIPTEITADILKTGMIICGGGTLIKGLVTFIQSIFLIPITICNEPLLSVINGLKTLENNINNLIEKIKTKEKQKINQSSILFN